MSMSELLEPSMRGHEAVLVTVTSLAFCKLFLHGFDLAVVLKLQVAGLSPPDPAHPHPWHFIHRIGLVGSDGAGH
jgi:hypothetical protein